MWSPVYTSTNSGSGGNGSAVTIASISSDGILTLASSVNQATSHTHSYDKTTEITLTAGTAPSLSTNTTKYLHHSHTSAKSAGTGTVGIQNGSYSATTRYLSAAPNNTATTSAANSGTNFDAATAVASNGTASVAPSGHTHAITATGRVTFTEGTPPSMESATTKYLHHSHIPSSSAGDRDIEISTGSVNATKYYLDHTHTAPTLGTPTITNVAPSGHVHNIEITGTTNKNSGNSVSVLTPVV